MASHPLVHVTARDRLGLGSSSVAPARASECALHLASKESLTSVNAMAD